MIINKYITHFPILNNIEKLTILELAEIIRARAEEIKKEENISDLKAFNKAYDELIKNNRSKDLCL